MRGKTRIQKEEPKPSLVSPIIAALLSIPLPGLGQAMARMVQRGLVLFVSFISIVGLLIWRIQLAARRDVEWIDIVKKAFRLQPFLLILAIAAVVLYLWIILDAYIVAKRRGSNPLGLLFLILIIFFALGWQIGQINMLQFIIGLDDAGPLIARVMWPWERAITFPEEYVEAEAPVEVPCSEDPLTPLEALPGEPHLATNPTCGTLTTVDGEPGTELVLTGSNFDPGVEASIKWEDPIGNEFRHRKEGKYLKVIPDENGDFEVSIIMPYRLIPPSAEREGSLIWKIKAQQLSSVGAARASTELKLTIEKIVETIFIGMMATFFGVILAVPVSFFAARNLMSASPITLAIYYLTRAVLNIIRSIEPLIWAIIFVLVVGLGPFAGILALTVHSIAALGKLYSESIESIDSGPIEAIHATGANWVQTVMFGVVPQIIPPFVSFTIYRWDINIRMSTIIGFVGGGGIGFLLAQYIRLLDYTAAGLAVWFIAVTVAILDFVSAEIRQRFI